MDRIATLQGKANGNVEISGITKGGLNPLKISNY
jgi:hypothetical protein